MNMSVKLNSSSKLSTGTMTELEQERVVGNIINYEKTGLDVACGLDTWQVTTNGVQVCMDNSPNVLLNSNSVTVDPIRRKSHWVDQGDLRSKKSDIVQTVYDCNFFKSAATSRRPMMDKCIDTCEAPCRSIINGHLPCRGFTLGSVEFRRSKYNSCGTMLFGGRRVAICKTCKNTL